MEGLLRNYEALLEAAKTAHVGVADWTMQGAAESLWAFEQQAKQLDQLQEGIRECWAEEIEHHKHEKKQKRTANLAEEKEYRHASSMYRGVKGGAVPPKVIVWLHRKGVAVGKSLTARKRSAVETTVGRTTSPLSSDATVCRTS